QPFRWASYAIALCFKSIIKRQPSSDFLWGCINQLHKLRPHLAAYTVQAVDMPVDSRMRMAVAVHGAVILLARALKGIPSQVERHIPRAGIQPLTVVHPRNVQMAR